MSAGQSCAGPSRSGTGTPHCFQLSRVLAVTLGVVLPAPAGGRRPGRVVATMKQHVQERAAKFPACFTTTVPAPPPAPIAAPSGKWSAPIIVNNTLPFTSGVIQKYWATGAPDGKCRDYANYQDVYVFRCGYVIEGRCGKPAWCYGQRLECWHGLATDEFCRHRPPTVLRCLPLSRWFATRTYDNAQVTVTSCGRLQNTGVPGISVRSARTSTNSGPYGCTGYTAYNCPYPDKAFKYTFKSVADTF